MTRDGPTVSANGNGGADEGSILRALLCPRCRNALDGAASCSSCGQSYPRIASIHVLLPDPGERVNVWRQQLGLVIKQADLSHRALEAQAAEAGTSELTRTRLRALASAILAQLKDLGTVVMPVLGDPLPPRERTEFPPGASDHISYLHRDWAWCGGRDPENEHSLAAIGRVTQGRPLGRTLVLGAGGGRLAYDLHVHRGATETAVVDIDPFLLVVAEAVIRGASVPLTEASANAPEVDHVSRRWTLAAPAGPLKADVFHFFLADGTAPPFADATFDTVVTPWFIDQVPVDLDAFLQKVHDLLVPGGSWINHGPLIYPPNALPPARWYSRAEIFALAKVYGFRLGEWESASVPGLVSPLTGRGKIETVLTFEAFRNVRGD